MNFEDEILALARKRIESRLSSELKDYAQERMTKIVEEEMAATAVTLSRWVNIKYFAETLTIEIRRPAPAKDQEMKP